MHIRRFANGKRQPVYGCANYKKQPVGTLCSSEHRIHEKAILDLISSTLKAIMEADRSNHEQLVETIAEVRKVNLDNNYNGPSTLFNAMIYPLRDYRIRGVIWYQGESNCSNAAAYGDLLERLIAARREELATPELPCYIIELAAFQHSERTDNDWGWNRVQKEQRRTAEKIPGAYLVPNADLGEWNDIHPQDKDIAGQRAAEKMSGLVYGK